MALVGIAGVAGLVLLVLGLTGTLGGAGSESDEGQIASLINRSAKAFNERDWMESYALLSPAARSRCSFEEFSARAALVAASYGNLTARNITVAVNGDHAIAAYDVYANGEYLGRIDDDAYSKEAGRWYDEDDDGIC